jgi:hypothetical protein
LTSCSSVFQLEGRNEESHSIPQYICSSKLYASFIPSRIVLSLMIPAIHCPHVQGKKNKGTEKPSNINIAHKEQMKTNQEEKRKISEVITIGTAP